MSAEAVQSAPAVQDRVASYAARSHAVEGRVFHLSPLERAGLVKQGVPARTVAELSTAMGLPRDQLLRVLGLARLIGQVAAMVGEGGAAAEDFDAARWFARWMAEPAPAFGGLRPEDLLDTADGREAVSHLLSQMKSGAYA